MNITTIAAAHVRALRTSDTVTFHMYEGQGYIRAHQRHARLDEYVQIDTHTRVENYGGGQPSTWGWSCFHSQYKSDAFNTVIGRLRKGDTLALVWVRDNNNQLNQEIGWHRDELRLVIGRPNGKAETYNIAVQVGPDNTARMVR